MVQNSSVFAKCLIDSSKITQMSNITLPIIDNHSLYISVCQLQSPPLEFGVVLLYNLYLKCAHITIPCPLCFLP